jgi:hypothetical protein
MRYLFAALALSMIFIVSTMATENVPASVSVFRSGEKVLTADVKAKLADWSLEFLKTSNFNTSQRHDVLAQSVVHVQSDYRKTIMGDYLVITFNLPKTVKTAGGNVTCSEIIVGLNRADIVPSGLFTVDAEGRIVAHEKYGGELPEEIRPVKAGG